MNIKTDISIGEFLDKMSILEIKSERIKETDKLLNINKERDLLNDIWTNSGFADADIQQEIAQLKKINETLWDIEDDIRTKESRGEFDRRFIELARAVYITNDQRAHVKKQINLKLGSELTEEKSYADYQQK